MIEVTGGPIDSVSEGWAIPYVEYEVPESFLTARSWWHRLMDEKSRQHGSHPLIHMTHVWRRI